MYTASNLNFVSIPYGKGKANGDFWSHHAKYVSIPYWKGKAACISAYVDDEMCINSLWER